MKNSDRSKDSLRSNNRVGRPDLFWAAATSCAALFAGSAIGAAVGFYLVLLLQSPEFFPAVAGITVLANSICVFRGALWKRLVGALIVWFCIIAGSILGDHLGGAIGGMLSGATVGALGLGEIAGGPQSLRGAVVTVIFWIIVGLIGATLPLELLRAVEF